MLATARVLVADAEIGHADLELRLDPTVVSAPKTSVGAGSGAGDGTVDARDWRRSNLVTPLWPHGTGTALPLEQWPCTRDTQTQRSAGVNVLAAVADKVVALEFAATQL